MIRPHFFFFSKKSQSKLIFYVVYTTRIGVVYFFFNSPKMKYFPLFFLFFLGCMNLHSQTTIEKGHGYLHWGWNRAMYTHSDLHLWGPNYDIVLHDLKATDRPTPFNTRDYFHPLRLTIPQTNFKMGYFIKDGLSLDFGFDHMKYIMVRRQMARITGYIEDTRTRFDRVYENELMEIIPGFLTYENTDGLNYIHLGVTQYWNLWSRPWIEVHGLTGGSLGILYPRTASRFIWGELSDFYHVAGGGVAMKTGLKIVLFRGFSIQNEWKGGYINMPDILTSNDRMEKGAQDFFFGQVNLLVGANIRLFGKRGKN